MRVEFKFGMWVLFTFLLVFSGCELQIPSGKDLKPVEKTITSYTPNMKQECNGNNCNLLIYSYVEYINEDNVWKNVREANSLKNSSVKCEVQKANKNDPDVECLDWNWTAVKLNVTPVAKVTSMPVKYYDSKSLVEIREKESEIRFGAKELSKIDFFELSMGEVLHIGNLSTQVLLNWSGNETTNDTYIEADDVNDNHGTDTSLVCGNNKYVGGEDDTCFISWNISFIPAGSTINNAEATLEGAATSTAYTKVFYYNTSWDEESMVYSNYDSGSMVQLAEYKQWASTGSVTFNVSDGVQHGLDDGRDSATIAWENLTLSGSGSQSVTPKCYSKEYTGDVTRRPKLNITYTAPAGETACDINITSYSPSNNSYYESHVTLINLSVTADLRTPNATWNGTSFGSDGTVHNASLAVTSGSEYTVLYVVECASGDNDSAEIYFNVSNVAANSAPVVSDVVLNASSYQNRSTDNLSVSFDVSDADGDAVWNVTDWRLNGSSIAMVNLPFNLNESGTGYVIKDYSSNENNGSLGTASHAPSWTSSGKVGGAYDFDGDDHIFLESKPEIGYGSLSIVLWYKSSYRGGTTLPLSCGYSMAGGAYYGYEVAMYADKWRFYMRNNTRAVSGYTSTFNTTDGQWHFIGVVFDRDKSKSYMYHNDSVVSAIFTPFADETYLSSTQTFYVGSRGTYYYFNGTIDELKVYSEALSSEQMLSMYQAGLEGHSNDNMSSFVTSSGDNWSVAVTSSDSEHDSATVLSGNVTINSAPTVSSVVLSTSPSNNNRSEENLTVSFTASDAESDTVFNATDWRVNGTSVAIVNWPFLSNSYEAMQTLTTSDRTCYLYPIGAGASWTSSGKVGGGLRFNGVDQYVRVYDLDLNETFTIQFWIKPGEFTTVWRLPLFLNENYLSKGFRAGITNSNKFTLWTSQSGGNVSGLTANAPFEIDEWNHLTITYDNTTVKIYLNGSLDNSINGTWFMTTNDMKVGYGWSGEYFNGSIDEFVIYNRTLSPEQIKENYDAGVRGESINTFVSQETGVGDNWSVAVTSSDLGGQSNTINSNDLVILMGGVLVPNWCNIIDNDFNILEVVR